MPIRTDNHVITNRRNLKPDDAIRGSASTRTPQGRFGPKIHRLNQG